MGVIVIVQYARREGLLLGIDRFTDEEGPQASIRLHELEQPNTDDNDDHMIRNSIELLLTA